MNWCVCMCVCVCACMCARPCVRVCVHACMRVYVRMCVFVYTSNNYVIYLHVTYCISTYTYAPARTHYIPLAAEVTSTAQVADLFPLLMLHFYFADFSYPFSTSE